MASEALSIEVTDITDLGALVDEVRRSRQPRVLRRGGEDVAMLIPTKAPKKSEHRASRVRPPTPEEVARSRAGIEAATGTWCLVNN
jgi:hypothetical protein